MAKSLSNRIAERVARKRPSQKAQNRAAFLAQRGDIIDALADGWPVKTIWETLHAEKKIDFSYQAFRLYVNQLIHAKNTEPNPAPVVVAEPKKEEKSVAKATPKSKIVEAKEIKTFDFNPKPNKQELV